MLKFTQTQSKAVIKTMDEMFSNGDADILWDIDSVVSARIFLYGLKNGVKTFGIITDDLKIIVYDVLAAADRLGTMTIRTRQNLVVAANEADILVCC